MIMKADYTIVLAATTVVLRIESRVLVFCPIRVRGRATDRPADPRMGQNLAGIRLGRRFSVKANGPPQARN
jgi:hypothetical protein